MTEKIINWSHPYQIISMCSNNSRSSVRRDSLILMAIGFLFFATLTLSCKKGKSNDNCNDGKQVFQNPAKPGGYNIWLGDHTVDEFIAEVESKTGVNINRDTQLRKCPCGDNIINIDYPGMVFEGHGPVKVRQPGGEGGELSMSDIRVAANVILYRDEKDIEQNVIGNADSIRNDIKALEQLINQTAGSTVKLAILDSGIDTTVTLNYLGVPPTADASCLTQQYLINGRTIPVRVAGFNFAPLDEGNSTTPTPDILNIHDTHRYKHGTRIAYIAARQFIGSSKNLQMLIMRVLNNQNKGDSFGIICAMVSAKKMGAQIINLSLGYYGEKDDVFENAFSSLNDNPTKPVWIVMAAGNYRAGIDTPENHELPQNRDLGLRPASRQFFPASFNSNSDNHLLTATTTYDPLDKICIGQNYGKDFVDLGVKAPNCNIRSGIATNGQFPASQQGTSFAAPAVAGWLGTQASLLLPKSEILKATSEAPGLSPYIRNGKYITAK